MTSTARGGRQGEGRVSRLIGPAFFAIAAWFLWGPDMLDISKSPVVAIDTASLSTQPRRTILSDPPRVKIDGFDRTCMECHRLFPPREDSPKQFLQHSHIVLDHGINKLCQSCHDDSDRNKLVLHGGGLIGYEDVVELCSKCHGPTYRDWLRGAHGRTNGYWDASRGDMTRLKCTECHDPHMPRVPAMDPVRPMPGPNTLRMGKARDRSSDHGEHRQRRNPLHHHRHFHAEDTGNVRSTEDRGGAR